MDDNTQDAPQATTQDYIDAIKAAKAAGKSMSINYGSLPEGVVAAAINTSLNDGLPDDYKQAIGDAAARGKTISIDFGQLPKPQASLPLGDSLALKSALFGSGAPLETPWSRFSGMFPKIAGAAAEGMGQLAANPTVQKGLGFTPPPQMIAAATTPLAMAPEIVSAIGLAKPALGAANKISDLASAGERIGAAEKAAGIITKAADKYPTSGNVGEVLNTLEGQLKNGTLTDPQDLQQAKDIIDYVWKNPNLVGKTKAITVQAARISGALQDAFNAAVPGRAAPAADFSTLMNIVNPLKTASKVIAGAAAGTTALDVLRRYVRSAVGHPAQ